MEAILDCFRQATHSLGVHIIKDPTDDDVKTVNSNLESGDNIVGAAMSYQEAVARNIAPGVARKVLKATGSLSSGALTLNSWTDQSGNTYGNVTTGKTLYISSIIVSGINPTTSTFNSFDFVFGDADNQPVAVEVSNLAVIPVDGMVQVNSGGAPTAKFANGLSDKKVAVTLIGWEE